MNKGKNGGEYKERSLNPFSRFRKEKEKIIDLDTDEGLTADDLLPSHVLYDENEFEGEELFFSDKYIDALEVAVQSVLDQYNTAVSDAKALYNSFNSGKMSAFLSGSKLGIEIQKLATLETLVPPVYDGPRGTDFRIWKYIPQALLVNKYWDLMGNKEEKLISEKKTAVAKYRRALMSFKRQLDSLVKSIDNIKQLTQIIEQNLIWQEGMSTDSVLYKVTRGTVTGAVPASVNFTLGEEEDTVVTQNIFPFKTEEMQTEMLQKTGCQITCVEFTAVGGAHRGSLTFTFKLVGPDITTIDTEDREVVIAVASNRMITVKRSIRNLETKEDTEVEIQIPFYKATSTEIIVDLQEKIRRTYGDDVTIDFDDLHNLINKLRETKDEKGVKTRVTDNLDAIFTAAEINELFAHISSEERDIVSEWLREILQDMTQEAEAILELFMMGRLQSTSDMLMMFLALQRGETELIQQIISGEMLLDQAHQYMLQRTLIGGGTDEYGLLMLNTGITKDKETTLAIASQRTQALFAPGTFGDYGQVSISSMRRVFDPTILASIIKAAQLIVVVKKDIGEKWGKILQTQYNIQDDVLGYRLAKLEQVRTAVKAEIEKRLENTKDSAQRAQIIMNLVDAQLNKALALPINESSPVANSRK